MSRQATIPLSVVCAGFLACVLSVVFWGELWLGGGLIGGDLYTYFLPQKAFLVERLLLGEFPLWNDLAGHGYPLLAESQTAPLYPFNFIAYRIWDVNTAYNAVQLVHYLLAFLFAWMYARRLQLSTVAALLAALVYTYAWFPPRICLEWAIIGGTWLPFALWCLESFLQTRQARYPLLISLTVALQLVAGHFNLAFVTLLVLTLMIPLRLWGFKTGLPDATRAQRGKTSTLLALALVGGFVIAMVQIAPTWELKQRSQRETVGAQHDPGYGAIPIWYLPQIWSPWWYADDADLNANRPAGESRTDRIEAHLYFGLIPLLLVLVGLVWTKIYHDWRVQLWGVLGIAALIYATGILVPFTRTLPGFSFFIGLGRYGIVTTLAVGIVAGISWDEILKAGGLRGSNALNPIRIWSARALSLFVLAGTTIDLWIVSSLVTYAVIIPDPVINRRNESPVMRILSRVNQPVRLFSRGANLPTLLGVASTPPYLGIGPAAYFDPEIAMPEPLPFDHPPTEAQIDWLQRAGVTHVLSFNLLDSRVWPVSPLWTGYDPFLNPAWARRESLFLYELHGSRGRVAWQTPSKIATSRITEYRANQVDIETRSPQEDILILTDLAYPGWYVDIDGTPAEAIVVEQMYRGVSVPAGEHHVTWRYQPRSIWWGAVVSCFGILTWLAIAHRCFWGTWGIPHRSAGRNLDVNG